MTSLFGSRACFAATVAALIGVHAATSAVVVAAETDSASRPNVLLVLADDLGYGDVACFHAGSKIPTPHLDRLAAEGIRFTHAYAAASVCVPSRYALLTGRYPFRASPLRWTTHPTIPAGQTTIASLLRERGYRTACVGKWHGGFDGGVEDQSRPLTGGPLDRGFERFFGQHGSLDQPPYFFIRDRRAVQPATEPIAASREEGMSIQYQGKFWRAGKIATDFQHAEVLERYATEAQAELRAAASDEPRRPFFLYLALTAPHGPWLPDARFAGKSAAGPLGDFVMHVDDVVGRVLKTLDDVGRRDDTLVIFTSDNGPLWFDPDVRKYGHDSSGGFRGRKGDVWEGGLRMPFLARWPGRVPTGATSDETIGLVDLLATLASVTGAPLPADQGVDSHDVLPALLGKPREKPLRDSILLQSGGANDLAVRQGPWKFIPWLGSGGFLSPPARVKPEANDPPVQLYHLGDDPGERRNVYAERPEVVQRLSASLESLRRSERTRPQ